MRRARFQFPILAVLLFAGGHALSTDNMKATLVGSSLWTSMQNVAINGNYAYCSLEKGLIVVDISDISKPAFIRQVGIDSGMAFGSTISGNYLYVALWNNGLGIYDLTDPANPSLVGHINPSGYINDVCVSGNYAYLIDQNGRLIVIDISAPSSPQLSTITSGLTGAFTVAIKDTIAYVGTVFGLATFNLASPDTAKPLSLCATPSRVYDISISNGIAYVACYNSGLQVIAIPHPDSMYIIGSHTARGEACGIYLADSIVYLACEDYTNTDSGLVAFNVHNPAYPIFVGKYDNSYGRKVLVKDSLAFVADASLGLLLINVADPAGMTLAGSYRTYYSQSVAIVGNRAYVAGTGFSIVDITSNTNPIIKGQIPLAYSGMDVVVRDTFAFVAGYPLNPYVNVGYFDIFSIADDNSPYLVSSTALPKAAYCIAIQGNYAYIGGIDSLRIYDISNPLVPAEVGSFYQPFCQYLAVRGDYAYVPNLKIINISNPQSPYLEGEAMVGGTPGDIVLSGNNAFVCVWTGELMMGWISSIDITNPSVPSVLDHEYTDDDAFSIALKDNYAIVGTYFGLYFFDITNPAAMVPAGSDGKWGTGETVYEIAVSGQYGYLATGYSMQIVYLHATCCDLPGDYTNNGAVNALDVTAMINRLYKYGPVPGCADEADADGNGSFNALDVTYLINYLYKSGPAPICP